MKARCEDTEWPLGDCWMLLKPMYGLGNGSAEFDKKVESIMENLGCAVGLFNPYVVTRSRSQTMKVKDAMCVGSKERHGRLF